MIFAPSKKFDEGYPETMCISKQHLWGSTLCNDV